jgi:hypothetical protein
MPERRGPDLRMGSNYVKMFGTPKLGSFFA